MCRHWETFENLQNCDRLGDIVVKRFLRETVGDALDAIDDVPVAALNISSQRIVKRNGVRQRTDLSIRQSRIRTVSTATLNQHILKNFYRRPQPQPAGLAGEPTKEMEQH